MSVIIEKHIGGRGMDKTMVNGITIIYDDSCLDKIDEIKETIKNNTEMFL